MQPGLKNFSGIAFFFSLFGLTALLLFVPNIIGARKDSEIIFSHDKHTEMGIECQTCHPHVQESKAGTDNLLPAKSICLQCHDQDSLAKYNFPADNPGTLEPDTNYSPKFSHAAHLNPETPCERCHEGVSTSDSSSTKHLTAMTTCMHCHNGKNADKRCIVCHEDPKGKIPADHRPKSWLVGHVADVLKDNGASCLTCHENKDCQACHQGEYLIPL
jgi:hypothetical protein